MDVNELLQFELCQFKNGWGKKVNFLAINEETVSKALSKALNDALAMAVKRYKTTYKEIEEAFLEDFVQEYIEFATVEKDFTKESFQNFFDVLLSKYIDKMSELEKPMFATYGFAQKFVSMSFKYMYCFDDAKKDNFKYCRLPLDKYTLIWYCRVGQSELVSQVKSIKSAWYRLDERLYNAIQEDISNILNDGYKYQIKCNDSNQVITLPTKRIEAEFIIWQQEQLNELFKELRKFLDYYDRLGICEE